VGTVTVVGLISCGVKVHLLKKKPKLGLGGKNVVRPMQTKKPV